MTAPGRPDGGRPATAAVAAPVPRRERRARPLRALAAMLLLCSAAAAPTSLEAADSPLPAAVGDALQRAGLPADALGAVVLPVAPALWRSGPRLQLQADRAMQPGSAMKLVTSIVALDRLGPNPRGFTELLSSAPQQGEVLAGDLVLRGGADPELGLPQLWAMLSELRDGLGIREIAGDIVIDRHLFRPARPDLATPPFDEKPEFPYNLVPDALNLAGSLITVALSSQEPARADAVDARVLPALPGLVVDTTALRLTDRACRDWSQDWVSPPRVDQPGPGVLRVTLQGGFPRDCSLRQALQLVDRNTLAERQLRWLWQGLGGAWHGRVREADAPLIAPVDPARASAASPPLRPGAGLLAPGVAWAGDPAVTPPGVRVLARHLARPWGEVLRPLNKLSDNALTRLLFLQLGLAGMAGEPASETAALAAREVRRWFVEHDIAPAGLVMDNGSGLSRSERITPRQLALMLKAAHAGRWAPELLASLPVAGVDGTMRNRLTLGPAAGQARLKTGTLRNVAALAGYVSDPQGRLYALVAIINHEQAQAGRPALDALVDWVARGGVTLPARAATGPGRR